MDIIEAISTLNTLFCANIEKMEFKLLKKLKHKRDLMWHPDKNPENPNLYKEQWIKLDTAWKIYVNWLNIGKPSTSSTNLFCDEEMWDSDEEFEWEDPENRAEYNNSGFSDEFFNPSPSKDFKIPDDHKKYFRSKSNRRAGKSFIIYVEDKYEELSRKFYSEYSNNCNYFGIFHMSNLNMILLCTLNDLRIFDIKKNLKKYKLHKHLVYYGVHMKDFITFCYEIYGNPMFEPVNSFRTVKQEIPKESFNHKMIADYALNNDISNHLDLMYFYTELASSCSLEDPSNEHLEDHKIHGQNAKIFCYLPDRKRAAVNACNCVIAKMYSELKNEKPIDFINKKCAELSQKLMETSDENIFGEAWYYCHFHIKKFREIAKAILDSLIFGEPRMRYTLLMGDFKSGKTTFASNFCKLFEGVSINVNVDKNRLSFFLGNAIGKRFVLFDDVKGKCHKKSLLNPGNGFNNLDDLRDHLDGHVEVLLEKKNQQPISQKFPPGIITCNKYFIDKSLLERVQGPYFFEFSKLWMTHDFNITPETVFIGCVLFNLLPVEPYLHGHMSKLINEWKQKHSLTCECLQVS